MVEYNNNGNELIEKRTRTFQGMRMMIIGKILK